MVNQMSFHIDGFSDSDDESTLTKDDKIKVLKA